MLVLRSRLLDVVQETRESKASASVVYFELKLRFLQVGVRLRSESPTVSPNAEQVRRRTKKNQLVLRSREYSVARESGLWACGVEVECLHD